MVADLSGDDLHVAPGDILVMQVADCRPRVEACQVRPYAPIAPMLLATHHRAPAGNAV